MKYIVIVISAVLVLCSCGGNNTTNEESHTEKHKHEQIQNVGELDPICGMTKNDDWTLYSTHGSDTIWFCSDYCKNAFDANPHKYLGEHAH